MTFKERLSLVWMFIVNRLDERSTWRAIIAVVTVFGVSLDPNQMEKIISAGVMIGGLLEMMFPENNETKVISSIKKEKEEIKAKIKAKQDSIVENVKDNLQDKRDELVDKLRDKVGM